MLQTKGRNKRGSKQSDRRVETSQENGGVRIKIIENNKVNQEIFFDQDAVNKVLPAIQRASENRSRKNNRKKPRQDIVHNRRWQLLETVRKNQPLTQKKIARSMNLRRSQIRQIIKRLENDNWLRSEENTVFEQSKARKIYYIGSRGKEFLDDFGINSFLYPANPYDPLEDGSRKQEIQRMKLDGDL